MKVSSEKEHIHRVKRDECPFCGGQPEATECPQYMGGVVEGELYCLDCEARWIERYRLIEIIYDEKTYNKGAS